MAVTRIASGSQRDAFAARLALEAVFFAATFVPFLLFFMLAAKRQVWHATMQLFPATERTRREGDAVGRDAGAAQLRDRHGTRGLDPGDCELDVLLEHWTRIPVSRRRSFPGCVNLIPYLGVVLSWFPPFMIGLKQFHSWRRSSASARC